MDFGKKRIDIYKKLNNTLTELLDAEDDRNRSKETRRVLFLSLSIRMIEASVVRNEM